MRKYKEFKLDTLFEKVATGKIKGAANDFPKDKSEEYCIPLLTAGIENQGLSRYARREDCPVILQNVISVSANGANTGVTFYQDKEFAVLQDAYALKLRDREMSEGIGLYLVSLINRALNGNYDWSNKAGWNNVKDRVISLPIIKRVIPDYTVLQTVLGGGAYYYE